MQYLQQKQKIAISMEVVAIIALISAAMIISVYFIEPTGSMQSKIMPNTESTYHDMQIHTDKLVLSDIKNIPLTKIQKDKFSDISTINIPVPESIAPEMIVTPD